MRRVFAVTTEEDFYACIDKGRDEDLDLGQILAILVHLYATTDITLTEYKDFAMSLRAQNRPTYREGV